MTVDFVVPSAVVLAGVLLVGLPDAGLQDAWRCLRTTPGLDSGSALGMSIRVVLTCPMGSTPFAGVTAQPGTDPACPLGWVANLRYGAQSSRAGPC